MPNNAVYVGRPTKWGNPFRFSPKTPHRSQLVVRYGHWLGTTREGQQIAAASVELAGKTLVCWCPLDGPCHSDLLWEAGQHPRVGNKPQRRPSPRWLKKRVPAGSPELFTVRHSLLSPSCI